MEELRSVTGQLGLKVIEVVQSLQESLAGDDAALVMRALATGYLRITEQWGDVIRIVRR